MLSGRNSNRGGGNEPNGVRYAPQATGDGVRMRTRASAPQALSASRSSTCCSRPKFQRCASFGVGAIVARPWQVPAPMALLSSLLSLLSLLSLSENSESMQASSAIVETTDLVDSRRARSNPKRTTVSLIGGFCKKSAVTASNGFSTGSMSEVRPPAVRETSDFPVSRRPTDKRLRDTVSVFGSSSKVSSPTASRDLLPACALELQECLGAASLRTLSHRGIVRFDRPVCKSTFAASTELPLPLASGAQASRYPSLEEARIPVVLAVGNRLHPNPSQALRPIK
mmetsp:Transcript_73157/g.211696  ORF Transcript_73157/g.211696 Transcript_73157/m.211696 type:complete len:283 (-) Transcript_73157:90-938(-)